MITRISPRYVPPKIDEAFRRFFDTEAFGFTPTSLLDKSSDTDSKLTMFHIGAFAAGNAGDRLLPTMVRDSVNALAVQSRWDVRTVYREVSSGVVSKINRSGGLVVGGGGLFLSDNKSNNLSGWQWQCSLDALSAIEVPIFVLGVGYNRFRGQPDFAPVFTEHLTEMVKKSAVFGLRNSGSIANIKKYLPVDLHNKVSIHPCPTTVIDRLYPEQAWRPTRDDDWSIALNCAFDREEMRFGDRKEKILSDIANAVAVLSDDFPIDYNVHCLPDMQMLPYLDRAGVKYRLFRLDRMSPGEIVEHYRRPAITLGMRGHAQMIPIGCGRPIVSISTHNKLQYFLEDIGQPNWNVEARAEGLRDTLIEKTRQAMQAVDEQLDAISIIQGKLFDQTRRNLAVVGASVK